MSSNAKAATERERKRQADACDRATGSFFCMGAQHTVSGEPIRYHGRKYCPSCVSKIRERSAR